MNSNLKKIYSKIDNNSDIIVFGLADSSNCKYCKNTKNFLKSNNINYKYYPIGDFRDLFFELLTQLATIHPELNINTYHKTVPVIFYKKKFIGGYDDLVDFLHK